MIVNGKRMQSIDGEVIVVEDDEMLSMLMVEILSDIGIGCIAFSTADDALVYLLQSDRDCALVIADHGIPGQLLGADLAKLVKEKWPDVEFIITSGYELSPSELPPGVRYLQKPWGADSLVQAITELFQPSNPV